MADYNLGALSYLEFELLIRDLLQEEWSVLLESFKSGKDRGIDIRYIDYGTTIIQCKHFFESTYANLKSHLNADEKEKVGKLSPDRYILVTSVELNPDRKKELKEIFNPFCKKDSDIYGREDILNLLNRHEKIVKRHYKLWFVSTIVLQNILEKIVYNEIYAKTEMDLKEFQKIIPKLVITKSFKEFEKILDKHNVCVICGSPGTGKTTMMKFFVLNYVERGYQPVMITENIKEAFSISKPDSDDKKIFYYDDFLGQTFLENNFLKNEDSLILLFIDANKNQKNRKFILSTREYVLKQAGTKSEKIKRVEDYQFILNCSELSQEEKAKILYNHIWHSPISTKNLEDLIENKNYLKIIQHKNFNPRLIDLMTKENNVNCENFIDSFIRILDNPSEIWKDAFENKISTYAQTILLILGTNQYYTSFETLWENFKFFYSATPDFNETDLYRSFKNGLNELDDTFIKSKLHGNSPPIYFDFNNPSVRDFVQHYLLNEKTWMNKLCEKSINFSQIVQIWNILQYNCGNEKLDSEYVRQHINFDVYLNAIENFFNAADDSFPFFENKILHLSNVTLIVKDSQYIDSLKNKLQLLIKRNFSGKTTQLDSLYDIISLIKNNNEFFSIGISVDLDELMESAKCAILFKQPTYITNFKLIQKYITHLGLTLDPKEMNLLKYRLNIILQEGIHIDEDFTIFTYNPDVDCFDSVESDISGLESIEQDLSNLSQIFGSCTRETLDFVRKKIEDYYESSNQSDETEEKNSKIVNKSDISNFESENEIDTMFESLKNRG